MSFSLNRHGRRGSRSGDSEDDDDDDDDDDDRSDDDIRTDGETNDHLVAYFYSISLFLSFFLSNGIGHSSIY